MQRASRDFLHVQDVVVALKLVAMCDAAWTYSAISIAIGLSPSQVHTAVRRLERCDLYSAARKTPLRRNLLEFLSHGVRYVFPATVGPLGRGVPTASSASPLDRLLPGGERFVWPSPLGEVVGQTVEPLVSSVPDAAVKDPALGELLALVDAIRIGKARERAVAIDELTKRLTVAQ